MSTRKSMTLPIIITLIFIVIIIYLFMTIKQSKIVCEKTSEFDGGFTVNEVVETTTDGKKINSLKITKTINMADRYMNNSDSLDEIKNTISHTLDYLGDNVQYKVLDDAIVVEIEVEKDELVLLDNINFVDNGGKVDVVIDTNTKSSNVVALSVGDNYTDGELMKRLKNNGYTCK